MIDKIDAAILSNLAVDARMSLKQLASKVHLSAPSTAERMRRMEERGVIRGYSVDIDPAMLGLAVHAIVRIHPLPGCVQAVQDAILAMPGVVECDRVTGEDCYVVRMFATTMEHLGEVVDRLAQLATTHTAIVKSQPIKRRPPTQAG